MVSLSQNGRMKTTPIHSPLQATVVQWLVQPAATFKQGDVLVILEAMKMEHEVRALSDGRVIALNFAVGDLVNEGESLLQTELSTRISRELEAQIGSSSAVDANSAHSGTSIRPDLQRALRMPVAWRLAIASGRFLSSVCAWRSSTRCRSGLIEVPE